MGLLRRVSGLGTAMTVWQAVRPGLRHPSAAWFGRRFLAAATVVVDRWGPSWAKRRLGTQSPIGAWLLLAAWIVGAVLAIRRVW